jgi:hypothetical protein
MRLWEAKQCRSHSAGSSGLKSLSRHSRGERGFALCGEEEEEEEEEEGGDGLGVVLPLR